MTKAQVFRPVSNILLAATALLLIGLMIVSSWFDGQGLLRAIFWGGAAAVATWLVFIRPKLVIHEDRIEVVNPIRSAVLGFGAIDSVNSRYFLTIEAGSLKLKAWVAPTPTRYASRGVRAVDLKGMYLNPMPGVRDTDALSLRAGDSPKAHSGQAGAILRIAMDSNSDRSNRKVEVNIHWTALAVAAAAAIVGFLV